MIDVTYDEKVKDCANTQLNMPGTKMKSVSLCINSICRGSDGRTEIRLNIYAHPENLEGTLNHITVGNAALYLQDGVKEVIANRHLEVKSIRGEDGLHYEFIIAVDRGPQQVEIETGVVSPTPGL